MPQATGTVQICKMSDATENHHLKLTLYSHPATQLLPSVKQEYSPQLPPGRAVRGTYTGVITKCCICVRHYFPSAFSWKLLGGLTHSMACGKMLISSVLSFTVLARHPATSSQSISHCPASSSSQQLMFQRKAILLTKGKYSS